jgi:copper chaperone CopZ
MPSGWSLISVLRYNTRTSGKTIIQRKRAPEEAYSPQVASRFAGKRGEVSGMRESEFHIKGMHCESCAVDIRETLETTAGVFRADVTFNGKTANVAYDDAVVQEKTLIKKIQDLGYDATIGDETQNEATA